MESLKEILMRRDSLTEIQAENLIDEARMDLFFRLDDGETSEDICQEWFGLEPDYLFELMEV